MKTYKYYLLACLSGILLALSYPPFPLSYLAFIGFVPLLFVIDQKPKRTFFILYLPFFIYNLLANWWIGSWQKDSDTFLMISGVLYCLVHPFFFMIPMLIYQTIRKRYSGNFGLLSFPFVWIAFEWAHSFGDLSFPWLNIGYTQIYNNDWIQFIDITGIYGASFLIVLCNVLFFIVILKIRSANKISLRTLVYSKPILNLLIFIAAIFTVPNIYGIYTNKIYDHNKLMSENSKIKIALIQPNINPWKKWETNVWNQLDIHKEIQDSLFKIHNDINLCIWSETTIHYISSEINSEHNFSEIYNWLNLGNTSLLSGFADIHKFPATEKGDATSRYFPLDSSYKYISYNSALLITPNKNEQGFEYQIYHKMKLTPFSERLPYPEVLSSVLSWVEWGVGISSWSLGNSQKTLNTIFEKDTVRIASIICIESIYPNFVRKFSDLGANIFVVITNDGWYDNTPGPLQHYLIACCRAIESKKYLARCANTGISGFIKPNGETLVRLEQYKRSGIVSEIPLMENKTFYAVSGDWLAYLSTFIASLLFLYSIIIKFRKK